MNLLTQVGIRELEKGLKKIDEEIGVGISCEKSDEKILKVRYNHFYLEPD